MINMSILNNKKTKRCKTGYLGNKLNIKDLALNKKYLELSQNIYIVKRKKSKKLQYAMGYVEFFFMNMGYVEL